VKVYTYYLLLEISAMIAVYTITIDAISAVPKETLIKYSAPACKCKKDKALANLVHVYAIRSSKPRNENV